MGKETEQRAGDKVATLGASEESTWAWHWWPLALRGFGGLSFRRIATATVPAKAKANGSCHIASQRIN